MLMPYWHLIINYTAICMHKLYYNTRIHTAQLKSNLIHAGNSHAFFMHVAHTRECVYGYTRMALLVYTHGKG